MDFKIAVLAGDGKKGSILLRMSLFCLQTLQI